MDMDIGPHLRTLRKARRLSFRKLGAQVRISHTNLAEYERGMIGPSFENAVKLCKFFGVPIEYFLVGEKADAGYRDLELVELFAQADELDDEYRRLIKQYIRRVVANCREKRDLLTDLQPE